METEFFDTIVIGGGPAGSTAAIYAARGGHSVLVLDTINGQIHQIHKLENYPGFEEISGFEYMSVLKKQAETFGARWIIAEATEIKPLDNEFIVMSGEKEYHSKTVIYAAGTKPSKLNVPGEKKFSGSGVSYCATCDGHFFKGKNVVVVGGSDKALMEAEYLAGLCSNVKILCKNQNLNAQPYLIDRVLSNMKIGIETSCSVKEIMGNDKVTGLIVKSLSTFSDDKVEVEYQIECDGVFVCDGSSSSRELVPFVKTDKNGFIEANEEMETDIPGFFVCGDVRKKSFRQVVTAVSDGAIAARSAGLYLRKIK